MPNKNIALNIDAFDSRNNKKLSKPCLQETWKNHHSMENSVKTLELKTDHRQGDDKPT